MNKYLYPLGSIILLIVTFICLIDSIALGNIVAISISMILFAILCCVLYNKLDNMTDRNGNFYTPTTDEQFKKECEQHLKLKRDNMIEEDQFIKFYSELPDPLKHWAMSNYYIHNKNKETRTTNSLTNALYQGWYWDKSEFGDTNLWIDVVRISHYSDKIKREIEYQHIIDKYYNSKNTTTNMDNKQIIQSEIDKLKKQQLEQDKLIKELEQKLNEEKDWKKVIENKCEEIGAYYYIDSIQKNGFYIDSISNHAIGRPSQFKFYKKEHAELMKEKMLLMQEMYAYAHILNSKYNPHHLVFILYHIIV